MTVEALPKGVLALNAIPAAVRAEVKEDTCVLVAFPKSVATFSVSSALKAIPPAVAIALKLVRFEPLVEVVKAVDASCLSFKELIVAKAAFAALVVM